MFLRPRVGARLCAAARRGARRPLAGPGGGGRAAAARPVEAATDRLLGRVPESVAAEEREDPIVYPPSSLSPEDFMEVRAEARFRRERAESGAVPTAAERVVSAATAALRRFYDPGLALRRRDRAWALLARCREQARSRDFVEKCGVPDQLHAKIGLIVLHVWMLKVRMTELKGHPDRFEEDDHTLGDIFSMLYEHVETRIFNYGTPAMLLNKRVREFEDRLYGNMLAYDTCWKHFLAGHGNGPFLGALWRNVYLAEEGIDTAHLVQVLDYVNYEINQARSVPAAKFLDADFRFGAPPATAPPPHAYRPNVLSYREPLVTTESMKEARAALAKEAAK